MQRLAPVVFDCFFVWETQEIYVGLVRKSARPIELRDPDWHRRAVCNQAKAFLALTQGLLGEHSIGDVDVCAYQANRAPVAATLDLGNYPDPANLAVVGPHDPILCGVVLVLTCYRGEELLFGRISILRVNTVDPILMCLICGLRWESVDQKVLWGAAISKPITKLDLDASNSTNTLNARQLGFTILQCAMRFVSFALDLLEVPTHRKI